MAKSWKTRIQQAQRDVRAGRLAVARQAGVLFPEFAEYLAAGPSRREQLVYEIYGVYRRFGFKPKIHQPEVVYKRITTAPDVAWRVTVWHKNIRPEDRNSSTLSDGAVFRLRTCAVHYGEAVSLDGGVVQGIREIRQPGLWYETIAQFQRLGSMSLAELEELQQHCRLLVSARVCPHAQDRECRDVCYAERSPRLVVRINRAGDF